MPKPLPPRTVRALSPPANAHFPYRFFAEVAQHPFQPGDGRLNLRNAWWLADAAFLAYSSDAVIRGAYAGAGIAADIEPFGQRSTQAYVAVAEDWIVLAIRGTQVDRFWDVVHDWAVNVRFLPVPESGHLVHAGFRDGLDEVWGGVSAHIAHHQRIRRRPLWIAGHSLGGAIGTLAARRCIDRPDLGLAGLYTYGSPRVGDRGFGNAITAPVFRFRHNVDVVAQIPIGILFRHVGALQFIDATGRFHPGMSAAGEMMVEARVKAASLAAALTRPDLALALPRVLADHAPINYALLIWNALEASASA